MGPKNAFSESLHFRGIFLICEKPKLRSSALRLDEPRTFSPCLSLFNLIHARRPTNGGPPSEGARHVNRNKENNLIIQRHNANFNPASEISLNKLHKSLCFLSFVEIVRLVKVVRECTLSGWMNSTCTKPWNILKFKFLFFRKNSYCILINIILKNFLQIIKRKCESLPISDSP